MSDKSDTPRTDALMESFAVVEGGISSIPLEKAGEVQLFAEQLERELAEKEAALKEHQDALDESGRNNAILLKRAEKAEAELEAKKLRLANVLADESQIRYQPDALVEKIEKVK